MSGAHEFALEPEHEQHPGMSSDRRAELCAGAHQERSTQRRDQRSHLAGGHRAVFGQRSKGLRRRYTQPRCAVLGAVRFQQLLQLSPLAQSDRQAETSVVCPLLKVPPKPRLR